MKNSKNYTIASFLLLVIILFGVNSLYVIFFNDHSSEKYFLSRLLYLNLVWILFWGVNFSVLKYYLQKDKTVGSSGVNPTLFAITLIYSAVTSGVLIVNSIIKGFIQLSTISVVSQIVIFIIYAILLIYLYFVASIGNRDSSLNSYKNREYLLKIILTGDSITAEFLKKNINSDNKNLLGNILNKLKFSIPKSGRELQKSEFLEFLKKIETNFNELKKILSDSTIDHENCNIEVNRKLSLTLDLIHESILFMRN